MKRIITVIIGVFLSTVLFNYSVSAELIDDFEDGIIDSSLWSIWAGNYGGGPGTAKGSVSEQEGSLVLYTEDLAQYGGGLASAVLRDTPLDERIYFNFTGTLTDTSLNYSYVPTVEMGFVLESDTAYNTAEIDGTRVSFSHKLFHDQQTNVNQWSDTYFYHFDSNTKVASLHQEDGTLLNSGSFAHFNSDPHIVFHSQCDTYSGEVSEDLRINEIWTGEPGEPPPDISDADIVMIMAEYEFDSRANSYTKENYENLMNGISDYYIATSLGNIDKLDVTILDNNKEWYDIESLPVYTSNEKQLVLDAVDAAGLDLDDGSLDEKMVLVVHSGETTRVLSGGKIESRNTLAFPSIEAASVAEFEIAYRGFSVNDIKYNSGTYAHEIGHIMGNLYGKNEEVLPDLYRMGNMNSGSGEQGLINASYDVMAGGRDKSNKFSQMSSFTKNLMGWLEYEEAEIGKNFQVKALDTYSSSDTIPTYNFDDGFYIFELRDQNYEYDNAIHESGLVLYEILKNGKDIPYKAIDDGVIYDGYWDLDLKRVLHPNDIFIDWDKGLMIEVGQEYDNRKSIDVKLQESIKVAASKKGLVMKGFEWLIDALVFPLNDPLSAYMPDIDLHVIAEGGQHVGMNYETGIFEMGIPGVDASGDMVGTAEWILLPDTVTDYQFYVSGYDLEYFLMLNPDLDDFLSNSALFDIVGLYNDGLTEILYESSIVKGSIMPGGRSSWNLSYMLNEDSTYSVNVAVVPEPSTFILFSMITGLLLLYRKRYAHS